MVKIQYWKNCWLYQVTKIFTRAYLKAAFIQNAISGFEACGVHQFNPGIFPERLCQPSSIIDRPFKHTY